MTAPSNSGPRPVLMVVGEKAFQMIDSQMLVAMNRDIPDLQHISMDLLQPVSMSLPKPISLL